MNWITACVVICFTAAVFCYAGRRTEDCWLKLVTAVQFLASCVIIRYMVQDLFFSMGAFRDSMRWLAFFITVGLLLTLLIYYLFIRMNQYKKEWQLNRAEWSFPLITGVCSLIGVFLIHHTEQEYCVGWAQQRFVLTAVIGLQELFSEITFHGLKSRQQAMQTEQENERQQSDAARYYQSIEDHYERSRQLWHDMRNHMNVMNRLIGEKDYGRLSAYMSELGDSIESTILPVRTGNPIMDALLGDKLFQAGKRQIQVILDLCPLDGFSMSPTDICAIFGNIIDNAMEACGKITDGEERFIRMKFMNQEGGYYFAVSNAIAVSPADRNGHMETDKLNRQYHGIGLRSVERTVHRYGGTLLTDNNGNVFSVVIHLHCK